MWSDQENMKSGKILITYNPEIKGTNKSLLLKHTPIVLSLCSSDGFIGVTQITSKWDIVDHKYHT